MTFDEALEILEMSSRENPEAARRAYLLQLQRNGPEVPPDLYARFTAAYEVLKAPEVWTQAPRENDSLADLKAEAAARRSRRGRGTDEGRGARIIDPKRVPQRNRSNAETRIIDPDRVPQRASRRSGDPADKAEAPRIRQRQQDARQAAPTDILAAEPQVRAATPPSDAVDTSPRSVQDPIHQPDPFSFEPTVSEEVQEESPTLAENAPGDLWAQEDVTQVAPAPSSNDPFADLLSADVSPEARQPEVDLSLGGEMEVHDESPAPIQELPPQAAGARASAVPDPSVEVNPDPLAPSTPMPKSAPVASSEPPARRKSRGRHASKPKPKAIDDTALALFSKIARTYSGLIEFASLVKTLEERPDDAIGEMALALLSSGERVAAAGLMATGFECMEGKPTRRWIEVRGCLELVLKLTETASEDHTSYECAQSIMRALNRWRTETEDPRIVFQEATKERWSWLNELSQLPQKLPHEIRSELVHAIRAGDLEEAVLPLRTFANRNEDIMAKLRPVLASTAPKMWGTLKPMLQAKPKKRAEAKNQEGSGSDGTSSGKRRRRRKGGQGSSTSVPAWAWGLIFVLVVGGVFVVVAMQAVEQETEPDDLQVAADGICKVVSGNKPACLEARRVARALRDTDCNTLSAGLIQDFAKAIEAAQQLRGALDTAASNDGNLSRHEDTLIDTFYARCQGDGT